MPLIGCGIEVGVVQEATREMKDQFGKWAYVWAAIKKLQEIPEADYELILDGRESVHASGVACVVANAGTVGVGRLTLAPSVDVCDGKLDVFLLKRASIEGIVQLAGKMTGLDRLMKDDEANLDASQTVTQWTVETVEIRTNPILDIQVDGDVIAKNGFIWLNPLHPDAQDLLIGIVKDAIVKYDIDGIQLDDRIVWPYIDMGYDEFTQKLYASENNGELPPKDVRDPKWVAWRQAKVEAFSKRFVKEIREAGGPELIVSLSPGPHPWALENYLIDWPAWSRWTDRPGEQRDLARIFRQHALRSGHAGHTGNAHGLLGSHLVAHQPDRLRPRSDEDETGRFDALGEIGVLRQETVAGMNRLRIRDLGCRNDCRHVEVALRRRRRADADRFIGQPDVLGFAVGFRMDDHGLDSQLAAGTLDAQRNLAAVRNQNLGEHRLSSVNGRVPA